jgi:hypothetical protein
LTTVKNLGLLGHNDIPVAPTQRLQALENSDRTSEGHYITSFNMTTLIILAIAGWALFAITGILYFVGNKANAEESNALAIYSVALMLSDEFSTANRDACEAAVRKGRLNDLDTRGLVYGLVQGAANNAKRYYKLEGVDLNFFTLVADAVEKIS